MTGVVLVVGSVNVDETLPVQAWPQPGETVPLAGRVTTGVGGKGANQAVAAALAGADVRFIGAVGADEAGAAARDALGAAGVDIDRLRVDQHARTGRATILVDATGENIILLDAGANGRVSSGDVDAGTRRVIGEADVVLVQGELAADVVDAVAAACAASGTRLVVNLAPPIGVAEATLAVADPLVVNEHEARQLELTVPPAEPGIARSLVVTLGAHGVVGADADGVFSLSAHDVPVVDTTGAGDAFAGTLAAALAAGDTLADACRAGAAAGAFAVGRAGASASYGTPGQITELLSTR